MRVVLDMDLGDLRKRLNELDRQLIELIAERQSVVEQVGELKRTEGQATRDYAREKQVLDGARQNATELGIAPDIVEEVMRLLIRTSLTRQERARVRAEQEAAVRAAASRPTAVPALAIRTAIHARSTSVPTTSTANQPTAARRA